MYLSLPLSAQANTNTIPTPRRSLVIPEAMSETPRRANILLPVGSSWAMLFVSLLYILTASVGYGVYGTYIGGGGSMLVSLASGVALPSTCTDT